MNVTDKKLFISEYSQLLQDKTYNQIIEKFKKDIEIRRKTVFARYTEWWHIIDNQVYNEKNAAVEVLTVLLEAKEQFEQVKATWIKYIVEEINDRIEWHTKMIQESIWGLQNGLTMSVYTETDIILRWAWALESLTTCYEKELENEEIIISEKVTRVFTLISEAKKIIDNL